MSEVTIGKAANRRPLKSIALTTVAGLALNTGVGQIAHAQAGSRVSGEDTIVVTATRKEQDINDVPISIAAFGRESLDQQGVRRVDDVARLTPGLTFTRGDQRNGGASTISIRGIASTAGSSTTGIYIDDTPIQIRDIGFSAFNAFPAVFDLERVEVLRGPQGTLFGAGSEGGTVRFITPRPEFNEFGGYGRSELATTSGGDASYEAGLGLNVPLAEDTAALRVSGYYRSDGGYIDRVNYVTREKVEENSNSQETLVAAASLLWTPTPELEVTPAIFYQKLSINDGGFYWEDLSDPDEGLFRNGNALANTSDDEFVLPSLKIQYDFGPVQLISNSSYFYRNQEAINDYTVFEAALWTFNPYYAPGTFAPAYQFNKQSNFTQEIRLQNSGADSRLDWVVGFFYQDNTQRASQIVENRFLPMQFEAARGVPFEAVFGQLPIDGLYTFVLDEARAVDTQIAGFGQVDFAVTDRLTLTAGVRVSKTKLEASAQFIGPVVGPPVDDAGSQKETPVTPKFGISYEIDGDNMVYASAAKGFRIGGYNPAVGLPCGVSPSGTPIAGTPLGNIGLANRPPFFESDSVWSYEVGAKSRFFDRLQINTSGFYIDWSDIQQEVGLACGFGFVDNLGSATSKGFDMQFQFNASESLMFGGAVGYTKAEFEDTVQGGPTAPLNIVTEGDDIALNPWQISLNGQYSFNLVGQRGYARFDYQYLSEQTAATPQRNLMNGGSDLTIPGRPDYSNLNLRAGILAGAVDVSLFVNNVTNSSPQLVRQHDTAASPLYRGGTLRPRTIGVTVSTQF